MDTLANRLARKLKALRGDESQLSFAKRLGISVSSLNRMEMAEQNVSLKTLDVLCNRLDCDVGELFAAKEPDK